MMALDPVIVTVAAGKNGGHKKAGAKAGSGIARRLERAGLGIVVIY
jgi:hypothetical protein